MLVYEVTERLWQGEPWGPQHIVVYGIVGKRAQGKAEESVVIPDISSDQRFVSQLAAQMERLQVSLLHMKDVIEDALWQAEDTWAKRG